MEAGYSYGEEWTTPRLLRLESDGSVATIATAGKNGPWNGVVFHDGAFFVAEGGVLEGGRILKITPQGEITALVEGLPSFGDHHTNGPAIGPDEVRLAQPETGVPRHARKGYREPSFDEKQLSDNDLGDMLAYLKALRALEEDER